MHGNGPESWEIVSEATLVAERDEGREREGTLAPLRVQLLGGFRLVRGGARLPDAAWQRRSAKTLVKLLATHPSHALHRDQVLETLWRDVDLRSGRNSLAKALHAARRALEPTLEARHGSSYVHLRDEMIALDPRRVLVDADRFQRFAEHALRTATAAGYERALEAYPGELLPEDRYEDWTALRRNALSELSVRVLLGLANVLERDGAHREAAERLRDALRRDPTREDAHRRLIRLYARMGDRGSAVRQFEAVREVLRRAFGMAPEPETEALYQDVLADRIERARPARGPVVESGRADPPGAARRPGQTPLVGGDRSMGVLQEHLARCEDGHGGLLVVTGEAGVGKTRLVGELTAKARERGVAVLGGGAAGDARRLPYGPFALALESYVASRPAAERAELGFRHPALAHLVPSLGTSSPVPAAQGADEGHRHLMIAVVRLLTQLAEAGPLLIILGDLDGIHPSSLELLAYLTSLAPERPWLMAGTLRDGSADPAGELARFLAAAVHDGLCAHVELPRLTRPECDCLLRLLLPAAGRDEALRARVYGLSLGNPLFVEELVRAVGEPGGLAALAAHPLGPSAPGVPGRVGATVAAVLGALDEDVRRVVSLAATVDAPFTIDDLRPGALVLRPPLGEAALLDVLDRALRVSILVEGRDGYAFRHPLVRVAVCEGLSQHRQAQLRAALERSREGTAPDPDAAPWPRGPATTRRRP